MFHTTHIHVPQHRRPSALRTFITSSSFGPPDTKEPIRRGILLTAVAFVLLLIGSILTWLGFNDVFGGRMSMTGPLLIALSLLLLLLSFRQFLLAKKRTTNNRSPMQLDTVNGETVTAVVVNHEDGLQPATIILDRYNRISYDNAVNVHRHMEDDCAPPSYQEVTQHSSSSNTPSCATHDGQDELPPTYEETMGSSIFHSHPQQVSSLSNHERSSFMPVTVPSVARPYSDVGRHGGDLVLPDNMGHSLPVYSVGSVFSPKPSPLTMPNMLNLQLEVSLGVGQGVAVSPMMQQSQHSLALPPLHLSAPTSPLPFSAPPSPRQASPHQHRTASQQHMATTDMFQHCSPPPSLYMLSAPPSPHTYSGPPSPHTFSAPTSPRPPSAQHSLTPPPQYTSAPPSPHQLSAPSSPHLFSAPGSVCIMSGAPSPSQPPLYPLSSPSFTHQLPPPPPHHFSVSHHPHTWASSPRVGSSHEGYTCFTYNFVTPLPVENSPSTSMLHGHTSMVSYPVPTSTQPAFPVRLGSSRPSCPLPQPQALSGRVHPGQEAVCSPVQPSPIDNSVHCPFSSRTDIQASI